MMKKIVFTLLTFVFLFTTLFVPVVKAQDSWYAPSYNEWHDKVFDSPGGEIFGERYTYAQVKWILYSIISIVTGSDTEGVGCFSGTNGDLEGCLDNLVAGAKQQRMYAQQDNSPLAMFGSISKPPISGIHYIKTVGQRLNIIPEANAQEGFGFDAINPILSLWKATRNITYAIFIIFILVTAFMIMFRVKLNPQTVISVQSALPKIIMALVLVTFSYAIAGLLIDLMYVVLGLLTTLIMEGNIFDKDLTSWTSLFSFISEGPWKLGVYGFFAVYWVLFFFAYLTAVIQTTFSSIAGVFLGIIMLLLTIIIFPVVAIVLIVTFIKILWMLFKTFATILLLIVAGPLMIAFGAVSQTVGFGSWLRAIFSNLIVYPITGLMFTLSIVFVNGALFAWMTKYANGLLSAFEELSEILFSVQPNFRLFEADLWAPPLTSNAEIYSLLYLGVSFVIIVMIPSVADMIRSMMQGKPFDYGTAIGESLGAGRIPLSYQLSRLGRGELPRIVPKRAREWFGASERGVRGLVKEGAKAGASALTRGNPPE